MVSFSCDHCQDVVTKPRVERHFMSCRTRSMSCIDCGTEFKARSVRAHTSCITEAEKYEGKGRAGTKGPVRETQTFCGTCQLSLRGAVAALQHYESKKHRAASRKAKAALKPAVVEDVEKKEAVEDSVDNEQANVFEADEGAEGNGGVQGKKPRMLRLKRAMKKALLAAPKRRLRHAALVEVIAQAFGNDVPVDLAKRITRKAERSDKFKVRKSTIALVQKT